MKTWFLFFLTPAFLAAADGIVTNQTTGKPQAGASVSLMQMTAQGPQPLENTRTGPNGKFVMTKPIPPGGMGPLLFQVVYQGVPYNKVVPPGQSTTGLEVPIFEVSKTQGGAKVDQHMMVLEPTKDGLLHVNEAWIFKNEGNTTWNDPELGTLRFELPAAAQGKVQISLLAPGGQPIQRPALPGGKPNTFKIDFPIRPGESQVQMEWSMPFTSPGTFENHILTRGGVTRLVAPPGITLKGDALESLGQEPRTQAMVYNLKGLELKVDISGVGAFGRDGAQQGSESDGGQSLSQNLPKIYGLLLGSASMPEALNAVKWLVITIFGMLALAFVLLYRRGDPATEAKPDTKAAKHGRGRG